MRDGPSAPPHRDVGEKSLRYGASKTQHKGAAGRETPIVPQGHGKGDTGHSHRMPTGKHTDGILGGKGKQR
jgi:hypothetical protein